MWSDLFNIYEEKNYLTEYPKSINPEFFIELSKILKLEKSFSKITEARKAGAKSWFIGGKINYLSQISPNSSLVFYTKEGRNEYGALELIEKIKEVMSSLSKKNLKSENKVLICAENKYHSLLIALACMGLGIQFGFIYHKSPSEIIERYIEIIKPELFIYETKLGHNIKSLSAEFIDIKELINNSNEKIESSSFEVSKPTCFLISSGTSGKQKVSYSGLIGSFLIGYLFNKKIINPKNRSFWMPLDFAWGPSIPFFIYPALIAGEKIILTDTFFKPDENFCIKENISSVVLSPVMSEVLIPNPVDLESIVFLGEKMSESNKDSFLKKLEKNTSTKVFNAYGQNEANTAILFSEFNKPGLKPFYGVSCSISSEGELIVKNNLPSLCPGFVNTEGYSELWDEENNLKTGDLVSINEEKEYILHGRKDQSIKIKGRYANLIELEEMIQKIFNIEVKLLLDKKDNSIVLFTLNAEINEEKIKEVIKEKYGNYVVPSKLIKLERFPINQAGKISLADLEKII